jgi:hypothetical protein
MEVLTSMFDSANWKLIDFRKYVDVSPKAHELSSRGRDNRASILYFREFTEETLKNPSLLSKAYASLADEAEVNNHHYMMCHEDMSVVPKHKKYLSWLAAATQRFEVTIVYTYRETMSLYVSQYNAHAETRLHQESLLSYIEHTDFHNPKTAVLPWKSHFENVVVMDYYGILAANQRIERVFFCEIMAIEGFCDFDFTPVKGTNSGESKEFDNKLAGVQRVFLEHAADKCQKLPDDAYTPKYLEVIEKAYQVAKVPAIPVKTTTPTKASKERFYELMVTDFDQYGSMKYKNITANADALEKASTYDVDGPAILNDASFTNMFKGLLEKNAHPGDCREIRTFTDEHIHPIHKHHNVSV